MKIISGTLKGRTISTTKDNDYRPTSGRMKEAIFSVLSSGQFINEETNESVLKDAIIIDLFGGIGALTFEAISRGSNKGIIIENNPANVKNLEINAVRLGVQAHVQIVRGTALDLPTPPSYAAEKCSIAFLDPPFNKQLISKAVLELTTKGWLANSALLIIESHVREKYELGPNHTLIFSRKYGKAFFNIYKYSKPQ